MRKEDFIKKLGDIKVEEFESESIVSKEEMMDMVEEGRECMDMGVVYYEDCGWKISVFR